MNSPNDFENNLEADMGGMGSGRHGYTGARDATRRIPIRSIVRPWKRNSLLTAPQSFARQYSRDVDAVASSIRELTALDQVIIIYRHRSAGDDGKNEKLSLGIPSVSTGPAVTLTRNDPGYNLSSLWFW